MPAPQRATMHLMGELRELTNATIGQVLRSDRPVLVDFWAPWCGRCTAFAPVLREFAAEHDLGVRTVNADHESALVTTYRVTGLPTLLLFDGGAVVKTIRGVTTKRDLEAELADYL